MYDLIGKPDPNNPKFSSLTKMIRVFVGVHDRSTDINAKTTYYAAEIIHVFTLHCAENNLNTILTLFV